MALVMLAFNTASGALAADGAAGDPNAYVVASADAYADFYKHYLLRPGDEFDYILTVDGEELRINQNAGARNVTGDWFYTPSEKDASVGTVLNFVVSLGGTVAIQHLDKIVITGHTVDWVEEKYQEALSKYYINPEMSIHVKKWHDAQVAVVGMMDHAQLVTMGVGRNHLTDVIAMAGGFNENSLKKNIFVVRYSRPNDPPLHCNLVKFYQEGDVTQNVPLYDGDVVYITNNGKVDIFTDILPALNTFSNFFLLWWGIFPHH